MNTATFSDPLEIPKPTALASSASGRLTEPNPAWVESVFNEAPVPTNNWALLRLTDTKSPANVSAGSALSGLSTPETELLLMLTVALPYTTSAMLNPALPRIANDGLEALRLNWAADTAV